MTELSPSQELITANNRLKSANAVHKLGYLGLEAAESDTKRVIFSGSIEKAREIDIDERIHVLEEGLDQSDKSALWSFGTALHDHEMQYALGSMSEELKRDYRRRYDYQDLIRERSKLRSLT